MGRASGLGDIGTDVGSLGVGKDLWAYTWGLRLLGIGIGRDSEMEDRDLEAGTGALSI